MRFDKKETHNNGKNIDCRVFDMNLSLKMISMDRGRMLNINLLIMSKSDRNGNINIG